jgi:catechol 2,3-dioxygenase-like lactoylglutathione lyase family enzyme
MADFNILKTNHTGLTVSDIDCSLAFYRDVFGFSVTDKVHHIGPAVENITGVEGAEVLIAFVDLPGHQIELIQYLAPEDRKLSALRACDTGFAHLAFEVDDVEAVLAAIRAGGFEPFNPPEVVPAGPRKGGKNVYTRDPDGVVLEFQQAPRAE